MVMQVGVNTAGGYLVPQPLAKEIVALVLGESPVLQRLRRINMTATSLNIPKETGQATAYWVGEGAAITASDASFGQVTLTAKKIAAHMQLTYELEADAAFDVSRWVVERAVLAMSEELEKQTLVGSTAGGDPFDGLVTGVPASNTVDLGGSTALGYDHLVDAKMAIFNNRGRFQDSVMVVDAEGYSALLKLKDSNGMPIFQPATNVVGEGAIDRALGLPVVLSRGFGATSKNILIADLQKAAMLGVRSEISLEKDKDITTQVTKYVLSGRFGFASVFPEVTYLIKNWA